MPFPAFECGFYPVGICKRPKLFLDMGGSISIITDSAIVT